MPRQVIGRILLVCAVLLAQQTALAHDLWHAAGGQSAADQSKNTKGKTLCDLHDLLGTVLGALSATPPCAPLLSFSETAFVVAVLPAPQIRPLVPRSTGPPPRS